MASLGSPILFSEYNAIQTTIASLIGPQSGTIPIGTGYGQTVIVSEQYPFSSAAISAVSNASQATVTTSTAHNLVSGEIIYIDSIGAGMTQLNDTYAVVVSVTTFTFVINVDTRTYTAWQVGQTARIQQFVVSANQFNRLRTDLARVRKHQTGFEVANGTGAGQLPVIVRGTPINYNVYDSFFTLANTCATEKYFLGDFASNQPGSSPATFTSNWTGTLSFRLEVEWPSRDAARQYFNTGGYVEFDINAGAAQSAGNNRLKDLDWAAILNNTPVNYGADSKANMGNRPGTWTTAGFYSADSTDRTIFERTGAGNYTSNYLRITHRAITERRIRFDITLVDAHANIFAEAVTADISIAYTFYYTRNDIELSYAFSSIVIAPTSITSS